MNCLVVDAPRLVGPPTSSEVTKTADIQPVHMGVVIIVTFALGTVVVTRR